MIDITHIHKVFGKSSKCLRPQKFPETKMWDLTRLKEGAPSSMVQENWTKQKINVFPFTTPLDHRSQETPMMSHQEPSWNTKNHSVEWEESEWGPHRQAIYRSIYIASKYVFSFLFHPTFTPSPNKNDLTVPGSWEIKSSIWFSWHYCPFRMISDIHHRWPLHFTCQYPEVFLHEAISQ